MFLVYSMFSMQCGVPIVFCKFQILIFDCVSKLLLFQIWVFRNKLASVLWLGASNNLIMSSFPKCLGYARGGGGGGRGALGFD